MSSRRSPDLWSELRAGDVVSFDSRAGYMPSSTYVRDIALRDDGRHVIHGTGGEEIVERASHRMRFQFRDLTIRLRDLGVLPNSLEGWMWCVELHFDFRGRQHPTIMLRTAKSKLMWIDQLAEGLALRTFSDDTRWADSSPAPGVATVYEYRSGELTLIPNSAAPRGSEQWGLADGDPDAFAKYDGTDTILAVLAWVEAHRDVTNDPQVTRRLAAQEVKP